MSNLEPWILTLLNLALIPPALRSTPSSDLNGPIFDFSANLSNLRVQLRQTYIRNAGLAEWRSGSGRINAVLQDSEYSFRAVFSNSSVQNFLAKTGLRNITDVQPGAILRLGISEIWITDCFEPVRVDFHVNSFEVVKHADTSTKLPVLTEISNAGTVKARLEEYFSLKSQEMPENTDEGLLSAKSSLTGKDEQVADIDHSDIENCDPSQEGSDIQVLSRRLGNTSRRRLAQNHNRNHLASVAGGDAQAASVQQQDRTSTERSRESTLSSKNIVEVFAHKPTSPLDGYNVEDPRKGEESPVLSMSVGKDKMSNPGQIDHHKGPIPGKLTACDTPIVVRQSTAQKARIAWGKALPRYVQSIPKDQIAILESDDKWRPPLVGRTACDFNIPLDILKRITDAVDETLPMQDECNESDRSGVPQQGPTEAIVSSSQRISDLQLLITVDELPNSTIETLDDPTQEASQWSLSPSPPPKNKPDLPPDSSPLMPIEVIGKEDFQDQISYAEAVEAAEAESHQSRGTNLPPHASPDSFNDNSPNPSITIDDFKPPEKEKAGEEDAILESLDHHSEQEQETEKKGTIDMVVGVNNEDSNKIIQNEFPNELMKTVQIKQIPYPFKKATGINKIQTSCNNSASIESTLGENPDGIAAVSSSRLVLGTFGDMQQSIESNHLPTVPKTVPSWRQDKAAALNFEDDSSEEEKSALPEHTSHSDLRSSVASPVTLPSQNQSFNNIMPLDQHHSDPIMARHASEVALNSKSKQSAPYHTKHAPVNDMSYTRYNQERDQVIKRKSLEEASTNSPKRLRTMQPPPLQSHRLRDEAYDLSKAKAREYRSTFFQNLKRSEVLPHSHPILSVESVSREDQATGQVRNLDTSSQSSLMDEGKAASTPATRSSMHELSVHLKGKAPRVSQRSTGSYADHSFLSERSPSPSQMRPVHRYALLGLHAVYKETYVAYKGGVEDFEKACLLIRDLREEQIAPHQFLWDDFIFRKHHGYPEWLYEVANVKADAVPYHIYYRENVPEPQCIKRVVRPEILDDLFNTTTPRRQASILSASSRSKPSRASPYRLEATRSSISRVDSPCKMLPQSQPVAVEAQIDGVMQDVEPSRYSKSSPNEDPLERSQHSSIEIWRRKAAAESPDLSTPVAVKDHPEIPVFDLSQDNADETVSSPIGLTKVTKNDTKIVPTEVSEPAEPQWWQDPDTKFKQFAKAYGDLHCEKRVVKPAWARRNNLDLRRPELGHVVDIFSWRN